MADPLSVEEMWQIVQQKRGFLSSPSGPADAARKNPATLPPGVRAGDKGTPVGKGYETFACIQVVDEDGNRVAIGADFFDHGGLENHAEARAIRGLEKMAPAGVSGGKLIVVVDQDVCPSCEAKLKAYGEKLGVSVIDVHVPERVNLNNPARMASPKTTARTSFMNHNKPTDFKVKKLRSIPVSARTVAAAHTAVSASMAKLGTAMKLGLAATGIAAAGLGLAASANNDYRYRVAADVLQPRMLVKWWMLQALKDLPNPKPDPRAARLFFTDPTTGTSLRALDLLHSHLKPFGRELDQHHARVRATAMLEIIAASMMSPGKRMELLDSLEDELALYIDELNIVADNLEAAKDLAPKVLESAKGAEQLLAVSERAIVQDWLLKQGFEYEEVMGMIENLKGYSNAVHNTFRDIDALYAQVHRQLQDLTNDASQVNKIGWTTFLEGLISPPAAPAAPSGFNSDEERVLRALPMAGSVGGKHVGLSPDEIYQIVRKDGRGLMPSVRTVTAALYELEQRGLVGSVSGPLIKRGGEYWREKKGDEYLKTRPSR